MRKVKLGNTEEMVSALCLGSMFFTGNHCLSFFKKMKPILDMGVYIDNLLLFK